MSRSWGVLAVMSIAACGDGGSPGATVTLTVPITTSNGTGASYLQKYLGRDISIEIGFEDYGVVQATSPTCGETVIYTEVAARTSSGANAADVKTDILDKLPGWELALEACDEPASSSVVLVGAIDELNVSFGCGVVPAAAQARDADKYPHITSFTATQCNAIILDVTPAFSVGNPDFSMTIHTGSAIP